MVDFLNTTFAGFDGGIFRAMHSLAESSGVFFTPFFKVITLLGEKGIIFILLAISLMLFKKTRKLGVCMFGAVACGALLTNVLLPTEAMFLSGLSAIGIGFSLFLLIVGLMKIHDYEMPRLIGTSLLSVGWMAVLVFLIVLVSMLIQQLGGFVVTVFLELIS